MGQDGYVSLWAGNLTSEKELQEYLTLSYDEEGDALPSLFEKDSGIDTDEDFMESDFLVQGVRSLPLLLEGCSYDEYVIPRFVNLLGEKLNHEVNCLLLIYNLQYSREDWRAQGKLKFLGSVRYQ
ncbi:immunity 22 family protein [Bacillus infantis]|uniref:immunity 22 family protein n=1 Tax=Bacillus infantis TaxID=324767 RepID=UPI003CEB125B